MSSFECVECGYQATKWLGQCPRCDAWESIVETKKFTKKEAKKGKSSTLDAGISKLKDISPQTKNRLPTDSAGFDRMLGGGLVEKEVVLLGGPPGVGKSTLFLQLADKIASSEYRVLFVSGEESPEQVKVHSRRLKIKGDNITVAGTGDLEQVEKIVDELKPDVLFIDSIQALKDPGQSSAAGSVKQVKLCGNRLTSLAKNKGVRILMSGQITKQGNIAGPKLLEHMVDAVMYMDSMEGSRRIITGAKNRFGSCGDFVIYSLGKEGLKETGTKIADDLKENITGQAKTCVLKGPRVVTCEIQALVTDSYFEYPLRRTSGYFRKRLLMLTAIFQKNIKNKLGGMDIYVNVSGGTTVRERTADLAVLAALYSSLADRPVAGDTIFIGETDLSGRVRPVNDIKPVLEYAKRNNFSRVVLSGKNRKVSDSNLKLVFLDTVDNISDVV
ncbi:MAG: ATPase domain-containing protein [Elusimicrobiota bacterium]